MAQCCPNTLDMGTVSILIPKTAHRAYTAATEAFSSLTASCLSLPDVSGQKWVRATPANVPGCRLPAQRLNKYTAIVTPSGNAKGKVM